METGRTRRWRWWHTLVVVLLTPIVVFAVWVGLVVVSLSGGLDDLLGTAPSPEDPDVLAAGVAASAWLEDESVRVTSTVLPPLGGGAERLGGGEVRRPCDVGQHNWKIDDDYDLACDLQRVEVVAVPDRVSFDDRMLALDRALVAAGWRRGGSMTMQRVLTEYWSRYASPSSSVPGTRQPPAHDVYGVDDLPGTGYRRTVDGREVTLTVGWVEPASSPDRITYLHDAAALRTADGHEATAQDLVAAVPGRGYAVVLTTSVEYFRA